MHTLKTMFHVEHIPKKVNISLYILKELFWEISDKLHKSRFVNVPRGTLKYILLFSLFLILLFCINIIFL